MIWLFIFTEMKKIYIHILFCLLLSVDTLGQEYLFNLKHFTVEDGLLGRRVSNIHQDTAGYIWLTTNEGLNRFDGYDFQHFTNKNSGLFNNSLQKVNIDQEGRLWIDFLKPDLSHHVQLFNTQTHEVKNISEVFPEQFSEMEEVQMLKTTNQKILLTTDNKGQFLYKPTNTFLKIPIKSILFDNANQFYWIFENDKIFKKNIEGEVIKSIPFLNVKGVLNASDSNENWLWVKQKNEIGKDNLYLIKDDTTLLISKDNDAINFKNKFVWTKGIIRWIQDGEIKEFKHSILNRRPKTFLSDNNNAIWIGTENGVQVLTLQEKKFQSYLKGASRDYRLYDARGIWANQENLFSITRKK